MNVFKVISWFRNLANSARLLFTTPSRSLLCYRNFITTKHTEKLNTIHMYVIHSFIYDTSPSNNHHRPRVKVSDGRR